MRNSVAKLLRRKRAKDISEEQGIVSRDMDGSGEQISRTNRRALYSNYDDFLLRYYLAKSLGMIVKLGEGVEELFM